MLLYFLLLFAFNPTNSGDNEKVIHFDDHGIHIFKNHLEEVPNDRFLIRKRLRRAPESASSPEFAEFLNGISAVGRILNGLTLDDQLRKGELDMVQLALELAGIAMDSELIEELGAMKWGGAERTFQQIARDVERLSGATWQGQKIIDGVAEVETLVESIRADSAAIDADKLKNSMEAISEIQVLDYSLLDDNPIGSMHSDINFLNDHSVPNSPEEEKNVFAAIGRVKEGTRTVEAVVSMLEAVQTKLESIKTRIVEGNVSFGSLMACLNKMKQLAVGNSKLTDFQAETENLKLLGSIHESAKSHRTSVLLLSRFVNAFLPESQTKMNLTLGLPNGLSDLEMVSADIRLSRNQKLIVKGGDLEVLNGNLKRVTAFSTEVNPTVIHYKLHHPNKRNQSISLENLRVFTAETTGIPSVISSLFDISSKLRFIFDISPNELQTEFERLNKSIMEAHAFAKLFDLKSIRDNLELPQFKLALEAVKTEGSAQDALAEFKMIRNIQKVKNGLGTLVRPYSNTNAHGKFRTMKETERSISRTMDTLKSANDWIRELKNFKTPDGLSDSLAEVGKTVGEFRKLDLVSWKSIGEVINEVQNVTATTRSFQGQTGSSNASSKQDTVTEQSIAKWTELNSLSRIIGHAVRSALSLNQIAKKLDEMERVSKELDKALSESTDQNAKMEVEKTWKGYGSFESEVETTRKEIQEVMESVPKTIVHLRDLIPVVEKMKQMKLEFAKLNETGNVIESIPTSSGDVIVDEKVLAVRRASAESLVPILTFQSHSKHLETAPDALRAVYSFFLRLFGISEDAPSSTSSPAMTILKYVGIVIGVMLVIALLICIRIRCRRRRKTDKKVPPISSLCPDPKAAVNPSSVNLEKGTASGVSRSETNLTSRSQCAIGTTSFGELRSDPKSSEEMSRSRSRSEKKKTNRSKMEKRKLEKSKSSQPESSSEASDSAPMGVLERYKKEGKIGKNRRKARRKIIPTEEKAEELDANGDMTGISSETNITLDGILPLPPAPPPLIPPRRRTNSKGQLRSSSGEKNNKQVASRKGVFVPNHSVFSDPEYGPRFLGKRLIFEKETIRQAPIVAEHPNRLRWINNLVLTSYEKLVEEAQVVANKGMRRAKNSKLKVHVEEDVDMRGQHEFLENMSVTGPELLTLRPPSQDDYGAFLGRVVRYGIVSIAAIFPSNAIQPAASDRWWPSEVNNTFTHDSVAVKLISESTGDETIYTAKLQMWRTVSRRNVTTVHLNILTADCIRGRLFAIEHLVRFHSKISTAQFHSQGNLLRYGDCMGQIGNMVAINQCVAQITDRLVEPKTCVREIQKSIHECVATKEEYIMIYLAVLALIRESLDSPKTPEQIEMERIYEQNRLDLEIDSTMASD